MSVITAVSERQCLEMLNDGGIDREIFDRPAEAFVSSRARNDELGGVLLDYWWLQKGNVSFSSEDAVLALHHRADERGGLLGTAGIYLIEGKFTLPNASNNLGYVSRRFSSDLGENRRRLSAPPVLAMARASLWQEVQFCSAGDDGSVTVLTPVETTGNYPDFDCTGSEIGAAHLPLVIPHNAQKKDEVGPNTVLANSLKSVGFHTAHELSQLLLAPNMERPNLVTDLTNAALPFNY